MIVKNMLRRCDETCILDYEYGEAHSHDCEIQYLQNCEIQYLQTLVNSERDMVNYLALKLQSFTGKTAVEEILEARKAVG